MVNRTDAEEPFTDVESSSPVSVSEVVQSSLLPSTSLSSSSDLLAEETPPGKVAPADACSRVHSFWHQLHADVTPISEVGCGRSAGGLHVPWEICWAE
jgi:hypothetical protein